MKTLINQIRKSRGEEAGFTLIELLIVIVILGILAAIVVFSVGGITDKGDKAACQSEKQTVLTANEAYFAKFDTSGGATPTYTDTAGLQAAKLLSTTPKYWNAVSGTTNTVSAKLATMPCS